GPPRTARDSPAGVRAPGALPPPSAAPGRAPSEAPARRTVIHPTGSRTSRSSCPPSTSSCSRPPHHKLGATPPRPCRVAEELLWGNSFGRLRCTLTPRLEPLTAA